MKILVLSSLAADTGSAVRAAYLAEGLKAIGLNVRFVKPLAQTLPFKLDLVVSLPRYLLQSLREKDDVVLAIKSYPNVGLPLLVKKILGTKIIIDTDDLAFDYSQGIWNQVSKFSQEIFLPLADLHTYHRPELLAYLQGRGVSEKKTYQLKQGVSLKFFKHDSKKKLDKVRKDLGLLGKQVLVFVGHFDVACDLGEILKYLPTVFEKHPHARLLLVGDGPRKDEFVSLAKKLMIEDKLVWIGLVAKAMVAELVGVADVCLVYYRDKKANYFRSSMKLREYLASGKKVVCNNVGELKEFQSYTYQAKTPVGFSKKIIEVLKKQEDGREKKGQQWVRKNCSWGKIGQDFANQIKSRFRI